MIFLQRNNIIQGYKYIISGTDELAFSIPKRLSRIALNCSEDSLSRLLTTYFILTRKMCTSSIRQREYASGIQTG